MCTGEPENGKAPPTPSIHNDTYQWNTHEDDQGDLPERHERNDEAADDRARQLCHQSDAFPGDAFNKGDILCELQE